MALNTFKCNYLTSLHFKGLITSYGRGNCLLVCGTGLTSLITRRWLLCKVMSSGLVLEPHSYLRSGWNMMDGCLVLISLIDVFVSLSAASNTRIFGILRVFRLLRTLRPLRCVLFSTPCQLVLCVCCFSVLRMQQI